MKIILSPAKKMNVDADSLLEMAVPTFINNTNKICSEIQKLSLEEVKELWKCNDKIAKLNYERFKDMNFEYNLTPAVLSYEGLAYKHLSPRVMTEEELNYLQKHLRILSGFYGVLKPFDGVTPYRLEMQAKITIDGKKNLYDFWADSIYKELIKDDNIIVNLASKEYSIAVEKYIKNSDRLITVEFGALKDNKIKQKATFAKMARGEMVRFMAENQIEDINEIKKFSSLGFEYSKEYSKENNYVFLLNK